MGHKWGVAERLVSSRNSRNARRWYQGLPSFWIVDCSAAAMGLSFAWLYEMKASERPMITPRPNRACFWTLNNAKSSRPRGAHELSLIRDRAGLPLIDIRCRTAVS